MMKLRCTIVDPTRSAFQLEIEAHRNIWELRNAITNKTDSSVTGNFALYLAQMNGAWVRKTDVDGLHPGCVSATFPAIQLMVRKLRALGLTEENTREGAGGDDDAEENAPVHVLVVLPESQAQKNAAWPLPTSSDPKVAECFAPIRPEVFVSVDFKKLDIRPSFLRKEDITIHGITNCVSASGLSKYSVPLDTSL